MPTPTTSPATSPHPPARSSPLHTHYPQPPSSPYPPSQHHHAPSSQASTLPAKSPPEQAWRNKTAPRSPYRKTPPAWGAGQAAPHSVPSLLLLFAEVRPRPRPNRLYHRSRSCTSSPMSRAALTI